MPSAAEKNSMSAVDMFVGVGMSKSKAVEVAKNAALSSVFSGLIGKAGGAPLEKAVGNLLYLLAQKRKAEIEREKKGEDMSTAVGPHTDSLVDHIKCGRIKSTSQLEAAFKFIADGGGDDAAFAAATGIGVEVTTEQIAAAVTQVLDDASELLSANRYRTPVGMLLGKVRGKLPWADGTTMKREVESQMASILGPRTEADDATPTKKKKKEKKTDASSNRKGANAGKKDTAGGETSVANAAKSGEPVLSVAVQGAALRLHAVGENDTTSGYVTTSKTKAHLAAHVKRVNGQVRTRFPPEPNGILHIGHAKAINFNFSYAAARNGVTFLRYDDTNPEKEEERFFTGIKTDVEWLGWKPFKITHSSDYFNELYDLAVNLIKAGKAYVCHMQGSDLRGHDQVESPWAHRPIEESLSLFEDMRCGLIDEGKATLRFRHTMNDGKVDPVAYRIKFCPHHRTGDSWCIYPTYDYTHCLVDSLEDITHSLCTKEFENRRPSYYWLCNACDVYCPVQWEYSRLNVTYTVVSKRKIGKLIEGKYVADWDDPRLMTLSALRRRGFPAEAVTTFCNKLGVTDSTETSVDPSNLEACVRDVLNLKAVRAMAAVEPLRVELVGEVADAMPKTVSVPNNPVDESMGSHIVPVCSVIYLSGDDFRLGDEKGYKRLTPNQPVGLKYLNVVLSVKEVVRCAKGTITKVIGTLARHTSENKPKAYIHWVSSTAPDSPPQSVDLRVYSRLFKHPNPEDANVVPGGFLDDVDTDSLKVVPALVDATCTGAKPGTVFQFERTGYYCVDPDSNKDKTIFNLTVGLRGAATAVTSKSGAPGKKSHGK